MDLVSAIASSKFSFNRSVRFFLNKAQVSGPNSMKEFQYGSLNTFSLFEGSKISSSSSDVTSSTISPMATQQWGSLSETVKTP